SCFRRRSIWWRRPTRARAAGTAARNAPACARSARWSGIGRVSAARCSTASTSRCAWASWPWRRCAAETTARIRPRSARGWQRRRLRGRGVRLNAEMGPEATRATARLTPDAECVLAQLFARRAGITARGLDRLIRTARTIADLAGEDDVGADAVREATIYRALDQDVATAVSVPGYTLRGSESRALSPRA